MSHEFQRVEFQLLATVIQHPELLGTLNLTPAHFETPDAGRMYEAVTELVNAKREPDVLLIAGLMQRSEDDTESQEFASHVLMNSYAVPKNLQTYEELILDAYRRRTSKRIGFDLVADGDVTAAMNKLKGLETGSVVNSVRSVRQILPDVIRRIDDISKGKAKPGVRTGFPELDLWLGGFQETNLIILAARTAVGKTAFMVNLALNARCPVGIISAEQSAAQLTERMLSNQGEINLTRLRTGKLRDEDWTKLSTAVDRVKDSGIVIADKSLPSIDEVEQTARRLHWEHGIQALFVDYLQYVRSNKYEMKYQQVGDVSSRLKALAKELQIPVIALAQLNRQAEGRTPNISDLRESGDIEQDADQIILLSKKNGDSKTMLLVEVAKNRHGPGGHFDVLWDGQHMMARSLMREEFE